MEYNIVGKYNKDCKIFAETIEDDAMNLVYNICNNPAFANQKIRIMPDIHLGKDICIGFSSTIDQNNPIINPSHIGVDIGCTVSLIKVNGRLPKDKYALFEHEMKKLLPMGFNIHEQSIVIPREFYGLCNLELCKAKSMTNLINLYTVDEDYIDVMCRRIGMDIGIFWKSLGTMGGGNHYFEYDEPDDDTKNYSYMNIHCGSRNFGLKVAKYWMNIANKPKHFDGSSWAKEIDNIKENYPKTEWNNMIKKRKEEMVTAHPSGYLVGSDVIGYLTDMVIAQTYAKFNHKTIMQIVKKAYKKVMNKQMDVIEDIVSTHNYIDFSDMIIRKGAVSAKNGQKLVIPMNMRDGILICVGKGNEDWNCTAPHGAGRLMSRSVAKESIDIEDYKKSMIGIYTTCVDNSTIDESPMAYKPMEEIISQIEPTVDIVEIAKPKINLKAGE